MNGLSLEELEEYLDNKAEDDFFNELSYDEKTEFHKQKYGTEGFRPVIGNTKGEITGKDGTATAAPTRPDQNPKVTDKQDVGDFLSNLKDLDFDNKLTPEAEEHVNASYGSI